VTPALLLGGCCLHLGFQATVTLLVYPALRRVPADRWLAAHAAHSRRIAPLVGVVYAAVAAVGAVAVVGPPGGGWVWVAGAASLVAGLTTATRGAPLHRRLARGRDEATLAALVRADRVRLMAAAVAAGAALGAVLTA
jgi:hypothetical protein